MFTSSRDDISAIYVMDADGGNKVRLTNDDFDAFFAAWQPLPLGDVNCDLEVNAIDAALILQLNAGLLQTLACNDRADVGGDGTVTSVDASLVLQFVAGFIFSLPA